MLGKTCNYIEHPRIRCLLDIVFNMCYRRWPSYAGSWKLAYLGIESPGDGAATSRNLHSLVTAYLNVEDHQHSYHEEIDQPPPDLTS
jgi:hypothetical protein